MNDRVPADGPLVSVLMTAYNREKYIGEAIESVLTSGYGHFELIITDDRSTDNTVRIANAYAAKDARVKVFVNDSNLGDYPNRNRAASYATGKYLKYIDADDLIYPWGLELLVKMMEQFPGAGWGLCSLEQDEYKLFPFELTPEKAYEYAYFGPGIFHKAPLSSIIKREVFEAIGGFTGKQHLGDFELWHLLACRFPVVLMPHGIVWHRVHDEQQSTDNRVNPLIPFKYSVSALHFFETATQIPLPADKIKQVQQSIRKKIYRLMLVKLAKMEFAIAGKMYSMLNDTSFNLGK